MSIYKTCMNGDIKAVIKLLNSKELNELDKKRFCPNTLFMHIQSD